MTGKLLIFSAPSGTGKTTIVRRLLNSIDDLEFSISATNRVKRGNEKNGEDYYFMSTKEFEENIKNGEFVEWEEVYDGLYYGTLISELKKIWGKNKHAVFDIDVKGGLNLKKKFADQALAIFLMPPSLESLKERLVKRNTDTLKKIETRMKKSKMELESAYLFDKIIVNDDLESAIQEAKEAVGNFIVTNENAK